MCVCVCLRETVWGEGWWVVCLVGCVVEGKDGGEGPRAATARRFDWGGLPTVPYPNSHLVGGSSLVSSHACTQRGLWHPRRAMAPPHLFRRWSVVNASPRAPPPPTLHAPERPARGYNERDCVVNRVRHRNATAPHTNAGLTRKKEEWFVFRASEGAQARLDSPSLNFQQTQHHWFLSRCNSAKRRNGQHALCL